MPCVASRATGGNRLTKGDFFFVLRTNCPRDGRVRTFVRASETPALELGQPAWLVDLLADVS